MVDNAVVEVRCRHTMLIDSIPDRKLVGFFAIESITVFYPIVEF